VSEQERAARDAVASFKMDGFGYFMEQSTQEGSTTTPFDMVVLNDLDRFHLVMDVIDRVPKLAVAGVEVKQTMSGRLLQHREYINEYGDDMPEVRDWKWSF
jgi:xylulose-5-phosphate/fructose-6-phosphate phosphoketolase